MQLALEVLELLVCTGSLICSIVQFGSGRNTKKPPKDKNNKD